MYIQAGALVLAGKAYFHRSEEYFKMEEKCVAIVVVVVVLVLVLIVEANKGEGLINIYIDIYDRAFPPKQAAI